MHKRILAGFPLLAAALIFLGLWIANKNTTPLWRSKLNQYIAYKTNLSTEPIIIQRVIQASQPWHFSAEMSDATFGDCFYFHADYCFHQQDVAPPLYPLSDSFYFQGNNIYHLDEAPLSSQLGFPPEDIWCAVLQTSTVRNETRWVVYIAQHQDLYNAEWIVHESTHSLSNPQLTDDLEKIGCNDLITPDR